MTGGTRTPADAVILVLGLLQCAFAAAVAYHDWPLVRADGGGGSAAVRLGDWVADERTLLVVYVVDSLLVTAVAALLPSARRRPLTYGTSMVAWLAAWATFVAGGALTSMWPGEHRFRWVAEHNVAADGGPFAKVVAGDLFWWLLTNPAMWVVFAQAVSVLNARRSRPVGPPLGGFVG